MTNKLSLSQIERINSFSKDTLKQIVFDLMEYDAELHTYVLQKYVLNHEEKLIEIEREYKKQKRKKGVYDYWKSHTFFNQLEQLIAQPLSQIATHLPQQCIRVATQCIDDFEQLQQKYDTSSGSWQDYLETLYLAWIKALGEWFNQDEDLDISSIYFKMKDKSEYFPYDFLNRYQVHLSKNALIKLRDYSITAEKLKQAIEISFILKDIDYLDSIYKQALLTDPTQCLQYARFLFDRSAYEKVIAVLTDLQRDKLDAKLKSPVKHLMIDALHADGKIQQAAQLCKAYFKETLAVDYYNQFIKVLPQATFQETEYFHKLALQGGIEKYLKFAGEIEAWQILDQTIRDQLLKVTEQQTESSTHNWFENLSASHHTKMLRNWSTKLAQNGFAVSAIFIRRQLVESNLRLAKTTYYKYAVSDLKKSIDYMDSVNGEVEGLLPSTIEYMQSLIALHYRKISFWRECQGKISESLLP